MGPPELTVAVHDNGFTLTCQWFIQSLCRYHNFQRAPNASARFRYAHL